MERRTVHRVCTICEATCGLAIEVEDRRVLGIQGDADDPFSRGHMCAKAPALADVHADPDRLRRPVKRTDGGFVEISWEEAFELAAEGLLAARAQGGADAIALYRGNPSVHDLGSTLYYIVLQRAVGTQNRFSAGSLDTWPRYVQVGSMFGGMLHIPVPDLDRTSHLLVIGANPVVSNGSLMTAPDVRGRLKALRARGGKLVVIDPRRSETADLADEHHFIRPGADAALLLAMIHALFEEDRVDLGRCGDFANGLDEVRERVAPYTPERVAARCGIDAETIRRLARELAEADAAVVYGRMGTCCQRFGTLACWAIDLLNVLTGNLDRPGGAMFARPAAPLDFAFAQGEEGIRFGRHRSRVERLRRDLRRVPGGRSRRGDRNRGRRPSSGARHLLRQPRGVGARLGSPGRRARLTRLHGLDRLLRERDHAPRRRDPAARGTARERHLRSEPLQPGGSQRRQVVAGRLRGGAGQPQSLGDRSRAGAPHHGARSARTPGSSTTWCCASSPPWRWPGAPSPIELESVVEALGTQPGPARLLDLLIRLGPYGEGFGRAPDGLTLARVAEHEHGLDLGPLEPALPGKLATASGRIELAPPRILDDLPRLDAWLERGAGRGLHADRAPRPPLDELVAPQQRTASPRAGALHAADPPRRCALGSDCATVTRRASPRKRVSSSHPSSSRTA